MDWLKKIIEFLAGVGRKRHLTFGRLLVLCGVGILAAPELWVQIAVMLSERLADFYGAQPKTSGVTVPEFTGVLCIVAGISTFWFFERRESTVVEGDGGIAVSIPGAQATLSFVLSDLLVFSTCEIWE